MERIYSVTARVWLYPGPGGWHFLTMPEETARDIEYFFCHRKKAFGSLPVLVTIGQSTWKTSIFRDRKSDSYVLPLKSDVRKKEGIRSGDNVRVSLTIA